MKLIQSTLLILSIASLPVMAMDNQNTRKGSFINAELKRELVQACVLLKQDNRATLKRFLRGSRLSRNMLKKGLVCNGMPALTFALVNGALDSATFIAGKGGISQEQYLAAKQAKAISSNDNHGD